MIYVTIIDDDKELRQCWSTLLNGTEGYCCENTYNDCETAIKNIEKDCPDIILMDIGLPGMSGIEGVRKIKAIIPDVEIIMTTVHNESDKVFQSLRAGACGYLVKKIEPVDLLSSITEAHNNGAPMSMHIARMITDSFKENPPQKPLSDRQRQVMKKLCEGKNYLVIANELFISINTVKFHIKKIYEILHVTNKAAAVRKATEKKLY